MPMRCAKCGKETYVGYLSDNTGMICGTCEDKRRAAEKDDESWKIICERMGEKC